ncbi:methyltransferase domain-containing protein [Clostridium chromiireducens]|uniref:Methyltransferase domain-containing protein n=2 Tax=Clostridium chromiireducens TaxID=225345 RepID=A0A399INN4_9CLOT|nr:methyltransferase domain-containing protein [Clostridium chromiireducens]
MKNLKEKFEVTVNNYSIIILTYNNLDYTKKCIESIKKFNKINNYEIVIVDNNSTDGTTEWLKQQKDIKYILNTENKGFPTGCNQGIEITETKNDIFLLNNDTVIMPNSIFNLRMGLYSNEKIGATGAVSNHVSYYQQIGQTYDTFEEYMEFAKQNNITNENSYESRLKLVGFAMLIKRNVLDKVGKLDELFTPGNFEDDDLCFRIILEGYKLLLCKDSFIYHAGSVSFGKDPIQFRNTLEMNTKKFEEKWGFNSSYSTFIRQEIIDLIDNNDKNINVLEVGCACGATLLSIKNKYPNSNIYGIELNESAAKIAGTFADVRAENIENINLSYDEGYFDYIIFADVLEHLYNPEKVLANMKKYLKDDGFILASIPNVMHYSVIKGLINGNWTYEDAGILDKTHIRFFTLNEIGKMFNKLNFKEISVSATSTNISQEDEKFIDNISKLSLIDVKQQFKLYQYIIKARNNTIIKEKIKDKLKFIMIRLDFKVDVEESLKELLKNIQDNEYDEKEIIEIIDKNTINKVEILNLIATNCYENKIFEIVIPILNEAYKIEPINLQTNYNLAYILNAFGESKTAMDYLNRLQITDEKIDRLRIIIGGKTSGK